MAKKYLAEFYPKLKIKTIARRMLDTAEGRALYRDIEHARDMLRYYTGTSGSKNLAKLSDRQFLVEHLPRSIAKPIKHYKIPLANRNILDIADLHIPYHDPAAIALALNYGLEHGVDTIVLKGDITDFYAVSRFETNPDERDLPGELYKTRDFLYSLREDFPNALIIHKRGNHEIRWDRHLMNNGLQGVKETELEAILHFQQLGIISVGSLSTIWAGKLAMVHGHEHKYGMVAPVNPARGLYLRTKQSAIMAHVHQASEHIAKRHDGTLIGCWSIGCLCQLTPEYMPYNNFGHGFAHIVLDRAGMFSVMNRKIINGKIY